MIENTTLQSINKIKEYTYELEVLCKDLFEKIKEHNLNNEISEPSLIKNLYSKIIEYVDSILTNLDKSQYYIAKTSSASLIEIIIHLMYISIDAQHLKDFEDFYYVDSLKLLDVDNTNKTLKNISKDDLINHNCQRFKSDKVSNITDENILNRKTYRKHYYKYNTLDNLLSSLNFKKKFNDIYYEEYRYFCDYKHNSPFSMRTEQSYEKDAHNIYTVICCSLFFTQVIINRYIENKFNTIIYQNRLDNITMAIGIILNIE